MTIRILSIAGVFAAAVAIVSYVAWTFSASVDFVQYWVPTDNLEGGTMLGFLTFIFLNLVGGFAIWGAIEAFHATKVKK